jgi:hypothetical protein
MERSESIYRHHFTRIDTSTNGGLADVVSRRTERRLEVGTNVHRRTLWVESRKCFKSNQRTGTPWTGSNATSGRTESGALMVSSEGTEQTMNTRDAYVTCTRDVQPRIPVTYTSHYPERISRRGYSSFFGNAENLSVYPKPELNAPTPDGGRSESQRRNAGFRVSASGCFQ